MFGTHIRRLAADESAATAIEYGLIVAVIGLALVTILTSMGQELARIFGTIESHLAAS